MGFWQGKRSRHGKVLYARQAAPLSLTLQQLAKPRGHAASGMFALCPQWFCGMDSPIAAAGAWSAVTVGSCSWLGL